jgi:hypothetical protein
MKYIQHWTDDLGRERYRFRRKGYPRVELPVNSTHPHRSFRPLTTPRDAAKTASMRLPWLALAVVPGP